MRKKILKQYFIPAAIILLAIVGCSTDSTPKATVRINLGFGGVQAVHFQKSFFNRLLSFFVSDASAQTAPEGITSIALAITGEGMTDINETYSPDTESITIEVPVGPARVFQVTAYIPTGNYSGSETRDLAAGTGTDIQVSMARQYASVRINPSFPITGSLAASLITCHVIIRTSGQTVLSSAFTPGNAIQVPAGADKAFSVTVETPSVSFSGSRVLDLIPGATPVNVSVSMSLSSTKLVIPDYGNHRIVQIDEDFDNPNWISRDATGLNLDTLTMQIAVLSPYDIDFDSAGRFYIVNFGSAEGQIFRIDDINDTIPENIVPAMDAYTLAIDRNNYLIYYVSSTQLCRANLNGGEIKNDFDEGGMTQIRGIHVTSTGLLLFAHADYYSTYNPNANAGNGAIIDTYDMSTNSMCETWDINVKNSGIFGTIIDTMEGNRIVQLSIDTSNVISLVDVYNTNLYGPHRIIETPSTRIYFIDDDYTHDSLSVIDDIAGSGRDDFGGTGTGTNAFWFYNY